MSELNNIGMRPTARRDVLGEIAIVLALSLGASAVYSILSLISKLTAEAGLAGSTVKLNQSAAPNPWLDLAYQLAFVFLGLAPVALVAYLLARGTRGWVEALGLSFKPGGANALLRGLLLTAAIGIPGLALYLAARLLGLAAKVEPSNLAEHWWTIPILLLMAVKAALLEETILLSYLQRRLTEIGVGMRSRILISAGLRGSYHLYQGFAGLVGNFVMGIAFAWLFERWRAKNPKSSTLPFVIAHFMLDAFVFVGYSLLDLSHVLP
mgnify:FL=1